MVIGEKRTPRGAKVPPTSRAAIRTLTDALRGDFEEHAPYVDVASFIEHKLYEAYTVILAPKSRSVLGEDEGRSYPDRRRIELRNDVYGALCEGQPRARFTAMHEVGHVFLHQGVALHFTEVHHDHDYHEDSEWQGDAFAAEFLMPLYMIKTLKLRTAAAIAKTFGVSLAAAMIRVNVLKAEGEIPMT
jgi:Zn-dependent peptidase ImmA (M78 family)